jgi:hypothetical protein
MEDIRQQCALDVCGTDYRSKRRAEESFTTVAGKSEDKDLAGITNLGMKDFD